MTLLLAILCILALLAMVCRPSLPEVSPVTPALALTRADALEATEGAIRASDYARIRAAANRFGGRVPRRTLNTAIHIARLAHDIASEPRCSPPGSRPWCDVRRRSSAPQRPRQRRP